MAYARIGERGSDVYVWSDGETLHCEAQGRPFSCTTPKEMIEHLESHQRRGDRVPDQALERLYHEMWGLPWETDVERTLRALKALPGAMTDVEVAQSVADEDERFTGPRVCPECDTFKHKMDCSRR